MIHIIIGEMFKYLGESSTRHVMMCVSDVYTLMLKFKPVFVFSLSMEDDGRGFTTNPHFDTVFLISKWL